MFQIPITGINGAESFLYSNVMFQILSLRSVEGAGIEPDHFCALYKSIYIWFEYGGVVRGLLLRC